MLEENTARTVEEDGQNTEGTAEAEQKDVRKRERSSIAFPYNPLEDVVGVAQAIHGHVGGGDCDDAQLSAWLQQSPKSSGYRLQLTAARMFGLLDTDSERRQLTALGRAIVDPQQSRAARADAFLRIPLYAALYERHKNGALPTGEALEREIVGLGVAEKQKTRARQVFERSAQQAGYFEQGKGRLVRPGVAPIEPASDETTRKNSGSGGDEPPGIDPIICGLLARLPKSGSIWPEAERKLWLGILENSFKLIYKDAPDKTQNDAQDA